MNEELTSKQAADVILYFHDNANREAREKGWNDKLALARAALRTIRSGQHSLLPDKSRMLTPKEMNRGLDYLENPPKSDEYNKRLDELVEKQNITYAKARQILDAEGLE
jgi:hypothetical protein